MSQDEQVMTGVISVNEAGHVVIKTDRPKPEPINVSRETLESIKRTLYNAIDKLDRMADSKQ